MPWLQTVHLSKLLTSEWIISDRFLLQRKDVLKHSCFGGRNNLITFKSEAKTWLFVLRSSVFFFCTDITSLTLYPTSICILRSSYKKITCNFLNAKILPTFFWTWWTYVCLSRLSLYIAFWLKPKAFPVCCSRLCPAWPLPHWLLLICVLILPRAHRCQCITTLCTVVLFFTSPSPRPEGQCFISARISRALT